MLISKPNSQKGYSQNRGGMNARSGMRARAKKVKIEDTPTTITPETKPENELAETPKNETTVIESLDEIKS